MDSKERKDLYANFEGWISCIPEEYKNVSLATCLELPQGLIELGRQWANSWPLGSMYLYGTWGSGKTTFAYSVIREVMKIWPQHGYFWPRWISAKDLDSYLLRAIKSDDGDKAELEKWADCDLLFIDDLDKVTATERFKNQFFDLINQRMIKKKSTIITSNCEPKEIAQILDGAVLSRMSDQSKWKIIQFPMKDLRKIKPIKFE